MSNLPTTRATVLAPTTFAEAERFAETIAKSNMVPAEYRGRPENILLAIQLGAELGMLPLTALQSIATINGRPALYGDAMLAVVRASGLCAEFAETYEGEGDGLAAVCTTRRRSDSEPFVSRFSVADAKRAHLWGKQGPWSEYPRRMLRWRARSFALRDAYPDVLRGLISAEEARDTADREMVDVTPPRDLGADLDAFAAPPHDPETGEIRTALDRGQILRDAAESADRGTATLREHLRALPHDIRATLNAAIGTANDPGPLLLRAQRADAAAAAEPPAGAPPEPPSAEIAETAPEPVGDAITRHAGPAARGDEISTKVCWARPRRPSARDWEMFADWLNGKLEDGIPGGVLRIDNDDNLRALKAADPALYDAVQERLALQGGG